jgi:hypothetical protein
MRFRIVLLTMLTFTLACSTHNPVNQGTKNGAKILVQARIKNQAQLGKTLATQADSLIIVAAADDMDTQRTTLKINAGDPGVATATLSVPAGKNRKFTSFAKNTAGITHQSDIQTVSLEAGEIRNLSFWLVPCRGSIYISLTDIPTTIDSVYARFVADTGSFSVYVKTKRSSAKTYLSLDNIPDKTAGILTITGLGLLKDTLYHTVSHIVFRVATDTTMSPGSVSIAGGSLSMNATLGVPGSTLVTASVSKSMTGQESGGLIITEIMYAVDDSEYIELFNPRDRDTTYDTLLIDKDGTYRAYANVVVKARSFFVIGRKILSWANTWHTVQSALDLSSTTGNWLLLRAKDSTVLDQVAFACGSNSQEWPNLNSAKKSIVLDSLASDPSYNNYGKHWHAAVSAVAPGVTLQCGTPGKAGL